MKNEPRSYRLAKLIQQTSVALEIREQRINKFIWQYKPIPSLLRKRKGQLIDLRSVLITELMKTLLGNEFKPRKQACNIWVNL